MILFSHPQMRAFTQAGAPASGAKLYFYKYGTTTPQNTYQDSALTTPHTNPVVADSNGWFAPVFLGTSFDYKAVCTNSDGSETYYTVDNIPNAQHDGAKIKSGTIPTSALADEAVTLAKMADLAQGSMIVGSASDRPTALALGDGQIPIGDGTGITAASAPLPPGFKYGCDVTAGTDDEHDLDITAGYVRDSTNAVNITVAAMTKRADASWSAGTGNGMMLTGSLASDTNYALYAIAKADGTQDFGLHTSMSDPSADLPADYVYFRKIKRVRTDSSANLLDVPVEVGGYNEVTFSDQTITAAGTLSLDHALGTDDMEVHLSLVCQSDEGGYSAGDIVPIHHSVVGYTSVNGGTNMKITSTNLALKYNNTATTFSIMNYSTGSAALNLTNAKWKLRIKARAPIQ